MAELAVATRESDAASLSTASPPRRRHAEILAPLPPPLTAARRRRAVRALIILAALAVLIQPVSIPAGHYLYSRLESGTDIYSQWRAYASAPAPDILFLGPSESRTDVDVGGLSSDLSSLAGRRVSVKAMGIGAAQPALLDIVMYRVMAQTTRPKVVVLTLEAPMFNANAVCRECGRDPLTSDIWQLSSTIDPGYYSLAFQNDPNRAELATGLALPSIAYYPSIGALECPIVNRMRRLFQAARPMPWELQQATPCEVGAAARPNHEMTAAQADGLVAVYQADFVAHYSLSDQLMADERDMVGRARAGGAQVVFLEPPFHSSIRSSDAAAAGQFPGAARALAQVLAVPVVDLGAAVPDDPQLWFDPLHLNVKGARLFAPLLAQTLNPQLKA
ncbi:MAG TPA: hypothetical protein VGG90_10355 [Candidatus Dormibacteraeota bacterium]